MAADFKTVKICRAQAWKWKWQYDDENNKFVKEKVHGNTFEVL